MPGLAVTAELKKYKPLLRIAHSRGINSQLLVDNGRIFQDDLDRPTVNGTK